MVTVESYMDVCRFAAVLFIRAYMHRYAVAVVLSWFAFFMGSHAFAKDAVPRPEVERLVRAFRSVEILQARASSYLVVASKPIDPESLKTYVFMERLVSAKPEDLFSAFVQGFSGFVSAQEAVQIAQALETPVGRKIIAMSVDIYRLYNGDVIAARDANPLSPDERKELDALGATPGWKAYQRLAQDAAFATHLTSAVLALPMFSDLR